MTVVQSEKRLAFIHRVIVPDPDYPKEYSILLTDRRSIFIHQEKSRSSFVLRREMAYGTALITDVTPKTLADYEQTSIASLSSKTSNITIPHESVNSLALNKDAPKPGKLDFFVRLTMRMQREIFQVYNLEMNYLDSQNQRGMIRFYLVPLGAYFKPKRQTQTRETILREYAQDALEMFRNVLPVKVLEQQVL